MKNKNFIPELLPLPSDCYKLENVITNLMGATTSLTTLNNKLELSKIKSELIMIPLLNQEAVSSTRIEGTQISIDGMFEAQSSDGEANKDIQEAINYINAIEYGRTVVDERRAISKNLIREMHKILMSNGVRGENKTPGLFKNQENFIGSKGSKRENADYIPPGPEHTEALMDNLLDYLNSNVHDDILMLKIAIIHSQFETIHPFLDGNGRIGRVLIPLFLYLKGMTKDPIFFLSKTLEQNQYQYYQNLNVTRWPRNWEKWINFFLEKAIVQSTENCEFIDAMSTLYTSDLNLLKSKHNHHQVEKFLNAIYEAPIFTVKRISEKTGIKYQTCRTYIKTLLEKEVIFKDSQLRNSKYFHYQVLEAIR